MRAGGWLLAAALSCALAWAGHHLAFAQFQGYDDEGYLLVTVKQFLNGMPLYDGIYTQYGPAYYVWQYFLHTLIAIPVTHDATRLVTVVLWLVCAALTGILIWLLTNRPGLTAIGVVVAFLHLTQLTFEPGHPQELCLLAGMSALVIATRRLVVNGHLGIPAAISVGALVALTALTKVNIGAFLAGALTLGLVSNLPPSAMRTVLFRIAAVAAVVAVPGLMRADLFRMDIAAWVVVVWSGLLAAFVAASNDGAADGVVTFHDLVACMAGMTIVSGAVIAFAIEQGSSGRALFEGLFVWPLLLPSVFWRPLPVPLLAAILAPLSALLALYRRRTIVVLERWMPFIMLAFGLIMFLLSIAKTFGPLLAMGPALAWLMLADHTIDAGQRAARRILAFAAILVALQVYPMPEGTQIALGTVLFVPVALSTMAGAERSLRAHVRVATASPSVARRAILVTLVIALATNIGLTVQRLYANAIPLELPGAKAVRTTERDAATYWWLRANLREHCDGFLTAPGLNSLHLWTGIAPVSTLNTTLWPILFDDHQQRRVIAAAAPMRRLCVAWAPRRMEALTSAPGMASRPLTVWLTREFEPLAAFGGWELRMRRGDHPTLLYQGRWIDADGIALELPVLSDVAVARLEVVDLDAVRTLADTARGNVVVLDEAGALSPLERGIDVSKRRRLTVRGAIAATSDEASVVVRLWAREGQSLAIVPIVRDAVAQR